LKVEQLEDWHRQNKCGSVDREQEKADRLIGPERRAHIPAHPHQSNHAIVFIVPRHQHGREKAKDKGKHQSKANPIVLHEDLDTDGALSSQDRWPAGSLTTVPVARIVQKLGKPHSTTRMEGSVKRLEL
jgi:hypothetical protein